MTRELTRRQLIERSIIKKYRKELWGPFITAVSEYELISPGERIAVCISGGKDSMLMAKLMQQLQRISKIPFEAVFLCMDPGYSPANRKKIAENADLLGIPLTFFESGIFDAANSQDHGSPCYLCARMRRGHLYAKARELGCSKIALGHHQDDVIETVVMAMFWSAKLETIIPKLHSSNFPGMTLIRPMYRVREEDIIAWENYNHLDFIRCACRFTENSRTALRETASKRQETKQLIRELRKSNPDIEASIMGAVHAVQLDTFPGYKSGGINHSFLERFDRTE
ncbi:MAG: tRNA 2-thiocytidine biosynthesis TtcA family protein [Lachnospiraceae bacterium]|nr:tRNA 2-thiocytidine biosynthesis TtcA family protein [Lachnospiraceae bacterium]